MLSASRVDDTYDSSDLAITKHVPCPGLDRNDSSEEDY